MNEITRILSTLEQGDSLESEQLLPLVYDELRKLAASRLRQEKPGQTLQATALVHEAYLRLVGPDESRSWANRAHFFAAAAEAMRRILVEGARRKQSEKRGGSLDRHDLEEAQLAAPDGVDVLELNEALDRLAARDEEAARLVKLRFFAAMTMAEAAQALGLSERTAERVWAYARSVLRIELGPGSM
jgi:RNA polymerase sigma factor (TIGR02999 family)